MTEPIRDRIKELRRVKASELRANPRNWREHPKAQQEALRGVLEEVGYADALLARETDDGLELIDGHLRADITPDAEVPVLILDVTAEEADKILATLDPLAAMAEANKDKLGELLRGLETENAGVQNLLDGLGESICGIFNVDEAGMPELPSGDREPFQQMTFTLADEQAADVKRAIEAAKKAGPFVGPNENSNGNALARIVEHYLGTC